MEDSLIKKLEERIKNWKQSLLDMSKRNRLLWYRPYQAGTLILSESIFDNACNPKELIKRLITDSATISFSAELPVLPDKPDEQDPDFESSKIAYEAKKKLFDKIKTRNKILENIRRTINRENDEKGLHIGYIAVGFLKWYEREDVNTEIKSPLIMVPILLEQESRISPYCIRLNPDEEITINPVIQKKFEADFNLILGNSEYDYANIDDIFVKINNVISGQKNWAVLENITLDTFNFQNLAIWNDLDKNIDLLKDSTFGKLLVGESPRNLGLVYSDNIDLKAIKSQDNLCVLETDSSQVEAMCRARNGESFVIQGPPGTGKSQTIANIIAQQLYLGKKVLFVSEKQAALDVVYHKLCQADLADFCLIMHNSKQKKSDIRAQIQHSLDLAQNKQKVSENALKVYCQVDTYLKKLNLYDESLHERHQGGKSPYLIMAEIAKLNDLPLISFHMPDGFNWNSDYTDLFDAVQNYGLSFVTDTHHFKNDCWQDYILDFSSSTQREVKDILCRETLESLTRAAKKIEERYDDQIILTYIKILEKIPFKQANTDELKAKRKNINNIIKTIALLSEDIANNNLKRREEIDKNKTHVSEKAQQIDSLKLEVKEHFKDSFFTLPDCEDIYKILTHKFNSFFSRFRGEYRQIIHKLDQFTTFKLKYADYVINLNKLIDIQKDYADIEAINSNFKQNISQIDAENEKLNKKIEYANENLIKEKTFVLQKVKESLSAIEKLFSNLDFDRMQEYQNYVSARNIMLCTYNLNSFIEKIEDLGQKFKADEILNLFKKRIFLLYLEQTEFGKQYYNYSREQHDKDIDTFREYDKQSFEVTQAKIRCDLISRLPNISGFLNDKSNDEIKMLKRELKKKSRLMPTRELIKKLPSTIPLLKPCMMMSPLTVSSYFSTNQDWKFDIVIFDEASQIKPEYAIPAIVRGRQLVVAGDAKQMPPSRFFDVSSYEDDEGYEDSNEIYLSDLESILDEMSSILPNISLNWHYRSKDEKLIAFSNQKFYDDKLRTFPSTSPNTPGLGVNFMYCKDGVWEGGKGNNAEAENVAHIIFQHIKDQPNITLGVIAFGKAQENAILEAVNKLRDMHPELENFFDEGKSEPFFIKNLENVQGDERDRIILSCGYGKDAKGTFAMRFGPLASSGGERRLNVAISRAKCQMTVVSSFRSMDIRDVEGNQNRKILRDFLYYAENGTFLLTDKSENQNSARYTPYFDSKFEEDVYTFLIQKGYKLRTQHGVSKYKIDMVVLHPKIKDVFVLAIECDGAAYHSSRTARDRDILRQNILEKMGWKFYRIWSTSWIYENKSEKEKLLQAVDRAIKDNMASC